MQIGDYVTVGGGGTPRIAATPALRSTQGTAVRNSADSLTLSAPSNAGGAAALYVPIEDGAGSVVVLTLAVQIEPRLVPPPKLDSTELQIEAGTSAIVDLAALTATADDEQRNSIIYAVGPGPDGVQTSSGPAASSPSPSRPDVPRGTVVAAADPGGRRGRPGRQGGADRDRHRIPSAAARPSSTSRSPRAGPASRWPPTCSPAVSTRSVSA